MTIQTTTSNLTPATRTQTQKTSQQKQQQTGKKSSSARTIGTTTIKGPIQPNQWKVNPGEKNCRTANNFSKTTSDYTRNTPNA